MSVRAIQGTEPPKGLEADNALVIHFKNLRKAVGCIGILLPFVLIAGKSLLADPRLLPSLSSYYHSVMRDVFVGSLCAIGTFLISYKGYDQRDIRAALIAGISVIGVALCPTSPPATLGTEPSAGMALLSSLHVFFAAIYFGTLAYFALVLFRETDNKATRTLQKRRRDVVYAVCGAAIVLCLALIAAVSLLPDSASVNRHNPVLWLESVAVFAFGISWFTKGEWLFGDPPASIADVTAGRASAAHPK